MPPTGLAILLGAGPVTGAGIARVLLANNLAVALLSRSITSSSPHVKSLQLSSKDVPVLPFQADIAEPGSLKAAFEKIRQAEDFKGLKLELAVFNVKHSHRSAFMEESRSKVEESLTAYVGGAVEFAQEALKVMLGQGEGSGEGKMVKKGTLVFTGTLGALRTNVGYAAYGAGRSSVRMLAQSLAREFSAQGIQVVHAIANGGIVDVPSSAKEGVSGGASQEDVAKVEKGERMRAESVGKLYLWLMQQQPDLWVHELDMRPAAENF